MARPRAFWRTISGPSRAIWSFPQTRHARNSRTTPRFSSAAPAPPPTSGGLGRCSSRPSPTSRSTPTTAGELARSTTSRRPSRTSARRRQIWMKLSVSSATPCPGERRREKSRGASRSTTWALPGGAWRKWRPSGAGRRSGKAKPPCARPSRSANATTWPTATRRPAESSTERSPRPPANPRRARSTRDRRRPPRRGGGPRPPRESARQSAPPERRPRPRSQTRPRD